MNNAIEIYSSQDGSIQLNVKLENDTVWLTQSQMAELFGVDRTSIVRHIRNIYKSEELDQNSTCAKNAQVRKEGHRSILREIPYYNLDMIISVGYRVNSKNATSFRRWATSVLKQYLIKGYAINQQIKLDRYNELKDVVRLMSRTVGMQEKLPLRNTADSSTSSATMSMRSTRWIIMIISLSPYRRPPRKSHSVPPTIMRWRPSMP